MLTIRPEQLHAFAQDAKDTFANQMVTQLRQQFPAQTAGFEGEALKEVIH
jgi:hypothetical protein